MKITKHEHAFLDAEVEGSRLVIDPGTFSPSVDLPDVVAIVITHEHDDHVSAEHLETIRAANPGVQIFGDAGVAAKVAPVPVGVVEPGDSRQVGPFVLDFVGGKHALIHRTIPLIGNLGVVVNDQLYHPGDSFALPERRIGALAVPTSGPWMKLGEAMDFVEEVDAPVNFAIHDMVSSEFGNALADRHLKNITGAAGHEFHTLAPGEVLDV